MVQSLLYLSSIVWIRVALLNHSSNRHPLKTSNSIRFKPSFVIKLKRIHFHNNLDEKGGGLQPSIPFSKYLDTNCLTRQFEYSSSIQDTLTISKPFLQLRMKKKIVQSILFLSSIVQIRVVLLDHSNNRHPIKHSTNQIFSCPARPKTFYERTLFCSF